MFSLLYRDFLEAINQVIVFGSTRNGVRMLGLGLGLGLGLVVSHHGRG